MAAGNRTEWMARIERALSELKERDDVVSARRGGTRPADDREHAGRASEST